MTRILYASKKGGKPMRMGMNYAKRIAKSADKRDQTIVQHELGVGLPNQHNHHQRLVKQRHAYYRDAYEHEEKQRVERIRLETPQPASASADHQDTGDTDRAVPEHAPGTVDC